MKTHTQIQCPGCGRDLKVRSEYLGRRVSCKHCGESFAAGVAPVQPADSDAGAEYGAIEQAFLQEQARAARPVGVGGRAEWPASARGGEGEAGILATPAGPSPADGSRESVSEAPGLAAMLEAERLRSEELAGELAQAQADLRGLRELVEGFQARGDDLARLEREAADARAERDRLRAELTDARGEIQSRGAELQRLAREEVDRTSLLAERDRLRLDLEASRVEYEATAARVARLSGLEIELEAIRGQRDLLEAEAQALRAELEDRASESGRLSYLEEVRDQAQAERDRLAEEVLALRSGLEAADEQGRAAVDEVERLRAQLRERERSDSEEFGKLEAECITLHRALDESRGAHDAERLSLIEQVDRVRAEEQARAEAELGRLKRQFSEAEERLSGELGGLREEVKELRRGVEAVRLERDGASARLDSMTRERDRLACLLEEAEAAYREGCVRLDRASEESRMRAEGMDRRAGEMEGRIRALETEVEATRKEAEEADSAHHEQMTALRAKLEAARSAAEEERTRAGLAIESARVASEQEVVMMRAELRSGTERGDHHEREFRTAEATAADRDELVSARREVAELAAKLGKAQAESAQIRSLLSSMGIRI